MIADDERELWTDLLDSKGWAEINRWAHSEWTAQKDAAITRAADDAADASALSKLRQIISADKAVHRLLGYPRERLTHLQQQQERGAVPPSLSRGGV